MKKLVCLLLIIGLVAGGTVAYARYAHISAISSSLSISGSTATCFGSVTADCSDDTCNVSVRLQRSKDKSSWSNYAGPWTASGEFPKSANKQATASVVSGYYYRTATTGTIYQGTTKVDGDTCYSPVKSY